MITRNMRRGDVVKVHVFYDNGAEDVFDASDVRVGSIIQGVSMDSKEGRDRMEWDTVEIHLSGHKRPVRRAED